MPIMLAGSFENKLMEAYQKPLHVLFSEPSALKPQGNSRRNPRKPAAPSEPDSLLHQPQPTLEELQQQVQTLTLQLEEAKNHNLMLKDLNQIYHEAAHLATRP